MYGTVLGAETDWHECRAPLRSASHSCAVSRALLLYAGREVPLLF
jgi:hypothetical protein